MKINVTDRLGAQHALDATPGWKIMQIIHGAGLDIKAECGGACVCSTCHVYVDEAWVGKLPARQDDEAEILGDACELKANSRLSCQLLMTEELDGLNVTLAPDWA
jgi:2Fe-2S ferredoxin